MPTYYIDIGTQLTQIHRINPRIDIQDQFHFEGFALAVQTAH